MDSIKIALQLTRLEMRAEIHEALLIKLRVALPLSTGLIDLLESRKQILLELEEIAAVLEKNFFSSEFAAFDDSEKALYSDEFREIVEHMKSYVVAFAPLV
jgi:hypothetical protein